MSAICLKCREEFSEEDHKCLEILTLDELHTHLTEEIRAKLGRLEKKDDDQE